MKDFELKNSRTIENCLYNIQHIQELARAKWVSEDLKDKAAVMMEDAKQTADKYSEWLAMSIIDSYVIDLMDDYTQEFIALTADKGKKDD